MAGDSFYKTKAWYRARQAVLTRDKYICKMCGCGVKGKGLAHIDHIIKRKERPDLALDRNNLQTLCHTCHNSTKARDENDANRGADFNGFPNDGSWY